MTCSLAHLASILLLCLNVQLWNYTRPQSCQLLSSIHIQNTECITFTLVYRYQCKSLENFCVHLHSANFVDSSQKMNHQKTREQEFAKLIQPQTCVKIKMRRLLTSVETAKLTRITKLTNLLSASTVNTEKLTNCNYRIAHNSALDIKQGRPTARKSHSQSSRQCCMSTFLSHALSSRQCCTSTFLSHA